MKLVATDKVHLTFGEEGTTLTNDLDRVCTEINSTIRGMIGKMGRERDGAGLLVIESIQLRRSSDPRSKAHVFEVKIIASK